MKTTTKTVHLDPKQHEQLRARAFYENTLITELVKKAIQSYLAVTTEKA